MKIVKFKDGTYGIRKRFLFFTEFVLLSYPAWTCSTRSSIFSSCKGTKVECMEVLERIKDKGKEI